jgi:hypothetical protein
MKHVKTKSSGWRSRDERGTWEEQRAREGAAQTAERRRDCDRLRLWRICPARRCRRARGCMGDPRACLDQQRPKTAERRAADARAAAPNRAAAVIGNTPPPVLSAKEAAALIAASIANGPESELLPDEEF